MANRRRICGGTARDHAGVIFRRLAKDVYFKPREVGTCFCLSVDVGSLFWELLELWEVGVVGAVVAVVGLVGGLLE